MTNVNLRLPDEVHAVIERLATEHDRSLNSEIIQACKAWIGEHRPKPTTFYVKLGADGQPTGEFLLGRKFWNDDIDVAPDEQWKPIEALDIDDLQQKMKVFR